MSLLRASSFGQANRNRHRFCKTCGAAAGHRSVSPSRTAGEIRRSLRTALKTDAPISLSEVARTLGYTTTERLYQADRTLCHKIASRYRQSGRSHWWRRPGATRICEVPRLKEILEKSLKSKEPASVHHIAACLSYSNDGYIQQKFPELCAAISRKIARRKQVYLDAMRRLLNGLLRFGSYFGRTESPVGLHDILHLANARAPSVRSDIGSLPHLH